MEASCVVAVNCPASAKAVHQNAALLRGLTDRGSSTRLQDCYNFHDFRELARRRLPGPVFDYIDGAADDETTYRRNTECFKRCDLVPYVLRGVENVDLSVTVMGQKLATPFIAPRLRFSVCFTTKASGPSGPPRQSLARCSGYRHSAQ
jgi:hypothetical protein